MVLVSNGHKPPCGLPADGREASTQ